MPRRKITSVYERMEKVSSSLQDFSAGKLDDIPEYAQELKGADRDPFVAFCEGMQSKLISDTERRSWSKSIADAIQSDLLLREHMRTYLTDICDRSSRNNLLDDLRIDLKQPNIPLVVEPYMPTQQRMPASPRHNGTTNNKMASEKPVDLNTLFQQLEMAVLLGPAGSGKSQWLKQCVEQAAEDSLKKLTHHKISMELIPMPVYVRLQELSSELEDTLSQ
jgi:hypothetical protein